MRKNLYTSLVVVFFSIIIKFKYTKRICLLVLLLINLSFIFLHTFSADKYFNELVDTKQVVCCCRLLEEDKKKNHDFFSQEFDINSRIALIGENTIDASLYVWNTNK
jgi:hypothetical protein